VPFLKFARDKRGYEHIYLVHAANRRGKPARPRVLYWYRTPPGIRVGRTAFDEEVRRALEAQNPGVTFDWEALVSTPIPPPDAEHWRERRKLEREAKQARRAEEAESIAPSIPPVPDEETDQVVDLEPLSPEMPLNSASDVLIDSSLEMPRDVPLEMPLVSGLDMPLDSSGQSQPDPSLEPEAVEPFLPQPSLSEGANPVVARRRRRRRGGRGRRATAGHSEPLDVATNPPDGSSNSSESDDD
jgi:hypothetical protein